jgi:hypothetical protein
MKIVITGKPYRYITEEKIRKVVNKVFRYLKEKPPPVIRIEFNTFRNSWSGTFRKGNKYHGWQIEFNYKISEKEFNYTLTHELVHFLDYRKRGYKIWDNSYAVLSGIYYFLNKYEYHAESVAVKLYPFPSFVSRFKKINKKMEEILNE